MREQPKTNTTLARILIAGDLSMLPPLKGFTRALAEAIGFSGEEVGQVELGLEELLAYISPFYGSSRPSGF